MSEAWDAEQTEDGSWETRATETALQEIEAATGRLLAERTDLAGQLGLTANGQHLLVRVWSQTAQTRLLKPDGLEDEASVTGWDVQPGLRVDGQPILLGSQIHGNGVALAVVDDEMFEVGNGWEANSNIGWAGLPQ